MAQSTTDQTSTVPAAMPPRERLIAAGEQLLDELSLAKAYAGITTAAVAERAGLTTGSFFHHFPTAADFADALALACTEEPQDQAETVEEMVDALDHDDLVTIMQANLTDTWQLMSTDPQITRLLRAQMHLWAHHRRPLHDPTPDAPDAAAVLRNTYRIREVDAVRGWNQLLAGTELEMVDPYTVRRLATTLTALLQGLQLRHAVDPEAVDDDLFGDVSTVLTACMVQRRGGRPRRMADVASPLAADADLSPQARSGARRRRETRRRVTEAATGMFDSGWESVSASDVADRVGVSVQTVLNLFPGVRAVTAGTFLHHVTDIQDALGTLNERQADPVASIRRVLTRLAECAAADPVPARALVGERLAAAVYDGDAPEGADIRLEVPLEPILLEPLARLDLDGADPLDVAATLTDVVLFHATPRPGRAAETAELALRLLPGTAGHGGTADPTG